MGDGRRPAAAHLFVDDLDAPVIDERDRHHVERVLRLRAGEHVTVSDGAGGLRTCLFAAGAQLEPLADPVRFAPPEPAITIGFALVKGERPELIVQKLTECGVDRIVPFAASRSIVRWDDAKARNHVERWRTIAREAAMQSRRTTIPEIVDVVPFADALKTVGAIADAGGGAPSLEPPGLLVGPEGGWTGAERAAAPHRRSLGPHVMRAETAAIAAAVTLSALRAGLVRSAS